MDGEIPVAIYVTRYKIAFTHTLDKDAVVQKCFKVGLRMRTRIVWLQISYIVFPCLIPGEAAFLISLIKTIVHLSITFFLLFNYFLFFVI